MKKYVVKKFFVYDPKTTFILDDLIKDGYLSELPDKKTLEEKFGYYVPSYRQGKGEREKNVSQFEGWVLCKELAQIAEQHHIDEGWVKPDEFKLRMIAIEDVYRQSGYVKKSDVLEAFDKAYVEWIKNGGTMNKTCRKALERL